MSDYVIKASPFSHSPEVMAVLQEYIASDENNLKRGIKELRKQLDGMLSVKLFTKTIEEKKQIHLLKGILKHAIRTLEALIYDGQKNKEDREGNKESLQGSKSSRKDG